MVKITKVIARVGDGISVSLSQSGIYAFYKCSESEAFRNFCLGKTPEVSDSSKHKWNLARIVEDNLLVRVVGV